MPRLSAGSSIPVFSPIPNRLSMSCSFAPPIFSEAMIVPTLLDSTRTPVKVICSTGWLCESLKVLFDSR